MLFLSVLTTTYNRAYSLPRLYEALCNQTDRDLEWVLVDDGSTDDTEDLVQRFRVEDRISVIYLKKENGGKMQAINTGMPYLSGKMVAIIDSDDYPTLHFVADVKRMEAGIAGLSDFCGVAGRKFFSDDVQIGHSFAGDWIDAKSNERRKYGISGDKEEIFYTEIFSKYPYPCFEGERFIPDVIIYNRMATDGYKLRWYNVNLVCCKYLPDGYTKSVNRNLMDNWQGYTLYVKELLMSDAPLSEKIYPCLGYLYRAVLKQVRKVPVLYQLEERVYASILKLFVR